MSSPRSVFVAVVLLLSVMTTQQPASADISYLYDALGRLIAVVDPASDTAVYQYDAVGNLLSISRYPSSTVSIIDFDPHTGPIGTTVTISGTGLSSSASQNTAAFNGIAATVVSATATQLVSTVPSGATTGPIAVTAPGGSATSSGTFTVTASLPPTITSFTPTIGTAGTAVSINGTNFEPVASNNRPRFNITRAGITTATATTLSSAVPSNATSGRLTVITPAGSGQSAADFFVPPPGYTTGDVIATGRIVINGSNVNVPLTTANKIGLVVFDGTAGQAVSLGVVSVSNWDADVTVFKPDSGTLMTQELFLARDLHVASLPVMGTYTILIKIRGSGTDTFTYTLSEDLPAVPITVNGGSVGLTIARRAQRTPLTFSGTTGQRLSVALASATVSAKVTVVKPDGSALTSGTIGAPSGAIDFPVLPVTGSYTVFIDPTNAGTGSMTVTLSEEVAASITIGGASVPLNIVRPGQRARVTFSGTAGQRLDLGQTACTIASGTTSILKPDGTTWASVGFGTANTALDTPLLPVTGVYTVLVDPASTYSGNVTLTLSEEIAGTITPGGSAVPVSITRDGQRARLSFTGTANQRVSVGLTGVTITQYTLSIVKPDGSTLASTGGSFLDRQTLPTSGTYAVLLDPAQTYTGSATVTLYDVPADVTGSLTINGDAVSVTVGVPGQQANLTFSGTSGQAVTARGANSTIGCLNLFVIKPSGGSSVISPCASSFSLGQTLSETGTFTVRVDPSGANVGSVNISVTSP